MCGESEILKISENIGKITTPHFKKIYRLFEKATDKAIADYLTVYDEKIPEDEIELFDPEAIWKRKVINDYYYEELLIPVFLNGKKVYDTYKFTATTNYTGYIGGIVDIGDLELLTADGLLAFSNASLYKWQPDVTYKYYIFY